MTTEEKARRYDQMRLRDGESMKKGFYFSEVQLLIRQAIALQIAAIEWHDEDVNSDEAMRAIDKTMEALAATIRKMKKARPYE